MCLERSTWAKRLVGRVNWDKYSARLEATIERGRDGAAVASERVMLTRGKENKQSLKLTVKQLLRDGYVINKKSWIPPEYAVVKIETIGELERHTVLRRTQWIQLDSPAPSTQMGTGSHELKRVIPVEIAPVGRFIGKDKVATAGATYEESVVEYQRCVQVLKKVWKRRVHVGIKASLSDTLVAVAPGLRVVLKPSAERKTGRTRRVVSYEDFQALMTVTPADSSVSACDVKEFSTANPEELGESSGLGGLVGVHGAEWEPIGMGERRANNWSRIFRADLHLDRLKLKGNRREVEAALRAYLGTRGQAFRLGAWCCVDKVMLANSHVMHEHEHDHFQLGRVSVVSRLGDDAEAFDRQLGGICIETKLVYIVARGMQTQRWWETYHGNVSIVSLKHLPKIQQ